MTHPHVHGKHCAVAHADIIALFRNHLAGRVSAHAASTSKNSDSSAETMIYHTPYGRHHTYDRTSACADRLIFSITPTIGVYTTLESYKEQEHSAVLFLHRPWGLDRSRLPRETLVLYNHTDFDERYTTGWNEAFADMIGVTRQARVCLQGYKDDPARKIGLLGHLQSPVPTISSLADRVSDMFGGHEALALNGSPTRAVRVIASLNAFNTDVVARILALVREQGWTVQWDEILCLTGAPRPAGMEAAEAHGMGVLAVGHRRAEMWGIAYLVEQARRAFETNLSIQVVDENEPPNYKGRD